MVGDLPSTKKKMKKSNFKIKDYRLIIKNIT